MGVKMGDDPKEESEDNPATLNDKEESIDMANYIHKKIAANEVYNVLSKSNTMSVILMIFLLLTYFLTQLHIYAGISMVAIFSLMLGFLIIKNKQRMKYYEQEYGIKPRKL